MASTLTHRALQHHASCFSIRSNMQSARSSREDEIHHDDGLTPRALNIRRSHLRENVPSPTRRYQSRFLANEESQEMTSKGQLRVMNSNPIVDHDYHDHRRAAIYLVSPLIIFVKTLTDSEWPSPAQQALQRVVTPQRSASTRSSKSRLSSFGSNIFHTVRRHKSKRKTSAASTKQNSPQNPLRAPPGAMSETDSQSAGGLSRSFSVKSYKSSLVGPQPAPMSVVAPFADIEPVHVSPIEYLTPGGIAAAKLEIHSFTAIYPPDDLHYSPAVTVWVLAEVKCVKFLEGILEDESHGISSITSRAQLTLRSHGQIANLAIDITPPEGFDIVCILGRLQHRQVLLGSTWSVVFKLQSHKKISVTKIFQRIESHHPDTFFAADARWASNTVHNPQAKSENEKLMDEVENLLTPEQEVVAHVQYSHNLFPLSTTMQESATCPVRSITESERRQRQFYEQRGQAWKQQRGSSILTTSTDLDRDLQMAAVICAVLQGGQGAKWPKSAKDHIRYNAISPNEALQLMNDFHEAAGATLPQNVAEELSRLKEAYQQMRKEKQEQSLTRKSLKIVSDVGRRARRAVAVPSTFSGRYSYAPSITESTQHLNPGRNTPENSFATSHVPKTQPWEELANTLKDITNDSSRRRGVGRFFDNFPIVGRRNKNASAHVVESSEPDLEQGVREEDSEITAI